MIKTELNYRVLYAHTDKMGVVYYGRYFEYFEAGRNDMLRKIGFPYSMLEKVNYALPVIEAAAKYFASAKYDDEVLIVSYLKSIPTVKVKIEYEIMKNEILLVSGFTVHSFVDIQKMKPVRPPENFIQTVKKYF